MCLKWAFKVGFSSGSFWLQILDFSRDVGLHRVDPNEPLPGEAEGRVSQEAVLCSRR